MTAVSGLGRKDSHPPSKTLSRSAFLVEGHEKQFNQEDYRGAGVAHVTIKGAGHFLQEDKGEEFARVIVDFIAKTRA